ncbi:MAG TPA: glutathione S-transferase family protein [Pseudolabrys sp.]|nr:glutathione S-transferase family protein [Pseudolabrys sp.]
MPTLTLYHASPSRSSVVLWMLEELGEPYEIKLIRLTEGQNLKPEYLAINPMGKVPALLHGTAIITEVAAICTYLADEFPGKQLNVPVGAAGRGEYLKWLFFGPSVFEPAMTDHAFPRKDDPRASALGWRDFTTVLDILTKTIAKGPYLLGEQFTAADLVVGSGLRYGMMFKLVPERNEFQDYVARLTARPAARRAEEKDRSLAAGVG